MKHWLSNGKVPPDHDVDHIKPLSIGGADGDSKMRLLLRGEEKGQDYLRGRLGVTTRCRH